ncbi:DUF945 family protein [Gallaecimonas kandeliae]|uniref:DUF945 family protein n=1 Tax=Gallaecimonas kandeliae TaxID=3029055 RepID=UPI002648ED1E|nr:DUF945 family protein [Gallaecimonas kandeliae]WKE67291.1 DUF945 family protein [Gallaecimonas kandeliae]
MKKTLIAVSVLALTAAGSTFYVGQQAEPQYEAWIQGLSGKGLKAESLGYDAKLLEATAKTRLTLTDPELVALLAEQGLPSSIILEHQFRFLPWQVTGHTQPLWEGDGAKLKGLFDDASPLAVTSVQTLWGSQSVEGRLGYLQRNEDGHGLRLFPLTFSFHGNADGWTQHLNWNGLEWQAGQDRLVLSGVKLGRKGQGDDQQYQAEIGALTFSDGGFLGLSNLKITGDLARQGGRVQRHSQWQADEGKYNSEHFKDLGLDLALDNLDEEALSRLGSAVLALALDKSDDKATTDNFLSTLTALLAKGGSLSFDKLRLSSDTGNLSGQGHLTVKAGPFDSLKGFMAQADGQVRLSLPQHLGSLEPLDADTLALFKERGWLKEQGQDLLLDFQIKNKQLTLNQQPLLSAL